MVGDHHLCNGHYCHSHQLWYYHHNHCHFPGNPGCLCILGISNLDHRSFAFYDNHNCCFYNLFYSHILSAGNQCYFVLSAVPQVPPSQFCKYRWNTANHFAQEEEMMNKHQGVQSFSITGLSNMFAANDATERYMMVPSLLLLLFVCSLQTGFLEATSDV